MNKNQPKPYLRGRIYWLKYHINGKPHYSSLKTADPKIAKIRAKAILQDANEAKKIKTLKLKNNALSIAYQLYIEQRAKTKEASSTGSDKIAINHFRGFLNRDIYVKDITYEHIEAFREFRLNQGIKKRTINTEVGRLTTFFNYCIRKRWIKESPTKDIKKFRTEVNPPNYLTKDQVKVFIEAAKPSRLYPMIATALYAGLRKGELLRLEWQDIRFDENLLYVLNKDNKTTKSKRYRAIPLAPALKSILEPLKRDQGHVFLTPAGQPYKYHADKAFRNIAKSAGLIGIGLHTLRHTFASNLVMAGVDLPTVKELMGHADIATTMIYTHLDSEHKQKALEKLNYE